MQDLDAVPKSFNILFPPAMRPVMASFHKLDYKFKKTDSETLDGWDGYFILNQYI